MNSQFWEYIIDYDLWINLGIALGILLVFLLLRKLFTKYVFYFILKLTNKSGSDLLDFVVKSYERPVRSLFVIIGIYIAVDYVPFIDQQGDLFESLIRSSVILMITWGLFNLASNSSLLLMKVSDKVNLEIDQILIPFISKAVRFIVVAISFSIIAQEFGYEVSGFVAGLGLGGLAFALAAQEVIRNLFGGVVIITEKPFTMGDWVETPSVEGVVEDITFRSTRIRTFSESLVTIPNSTLSNEPITNWSEMGKRRIFFNLGVEYSTPKDKLESVVERIRELLEKHEDIHQETIFVRFDKYNDSSLDIMLYFFTKTTQWEEYLIIKEDINFKILDILEEEEVSIAYPSRKLYFDAEEEAMKRSSSSFNDDE
ncbi:mechanosensitive ion channel family protein [Alkalibacillus haloalkaliphilus]|uniref:mechanosensitive ion channel family protein n=1 Tax=Alkalibacillus haloalkaliphilus TaxID=94136 RepID=UPI0029360273|nr:mechanosensitive ion channel family protein [Alkalibacillus haloalkaliphilus]MDV2581951.1 mechanosensitive ion channel family protein [Alkalibacillus haloalkaliphilus]